MKTIKEIEEKLVKFVDELKKDIEELKKGTKKEPEPGEVIEIAGIRWIILDKTEKGYLALAETKIDKTKFGENNDWKESSLRKRLNNEIALSIENKIGCALPEFDRDLLSMDGQTEYGTCTDKVSLISVDEYRKYRRFIPNGKDGYWWTLTPDSTKCNDDSTYIRIVSPSGGIICYYYFSNNCGVRPFCIFPSSLFESEDK